MLEQVSADPAHPRFLDAGKVLIELRGWRASQEKLTHDKVDPSAFVQMVARATVAHTNVRSFLEKEVLPHVNKASTE